MPTEAKAKPRKALRLSANCAAGTHHACIGTVYVWPVDPDGNRIGKCECPHCEHRVTGLIVR